MKLLPLALLALLAAPTPAPGQPRASASLVVRTDEPRARWRLVGPGTIASGGGALAVHGPLRPGDYTLLFDPLPPLRSRPGPLSVHLPAAARAGVSARWRSAPALPPAPPLLADGFDRAPNAPGAAGVLALEPGRRLRLGEDRWADYWLGVSVRVAGPRGIVGVEFRRRGPTETYRLEWRLAEGVCRLLRLGDGDVVELGRLEVTPRPGAWHRLECEAVGFGLRARLDGAEVARLLDGGQAAGGLALFVEGGHAEFDDLLVLRPLREHGVLAAIETPGNLVLRLEHPERPARPALLGLAFPRFEGRAQSTLLWRPRMLDGRGRGATTLVVPANRALLGRRLRARAALVADSGEPAPERLDPIEVTLR